MTDACSNTIEKYLLKQNEYFRTGVTKNYKFRIAQLKKLKKAIKTYEADIMEALNQDLGKNKVESYATEIGFVYRSIGETIKKLRSWMRPKRVGTPIYLFPGRSQIVYEPYGTVLIIGPFNYPFQLIMEPLVGAIAAGNCAILKPSELSPKVAEIVDCIIRDAFEEDYIRCVQGGVETNIELMNSNFDYIFFTGSMQVGKLVMEAAAKNLTPVTLELGGKSPVIVDKDTNLKNTAHKIIWGKTVNAGQTCVAPDYVYVHEEILEPLIEEMKQAVFHFYGECVIESSSYGRIINERHYHRLANILEADQDRIVYGGEKKEKERFIAPTFLLASKDSACMREEIFGPLLPIMPYSDLEEVICNINQMHKPLALYLFSEDNSTIKKVLGETTSGGVAINDTIMHLVNPNLPFGGVGNSGMGSYHGKSSFLLFSHAKSILRKSNRVMLTLMYPPYNDKKLKLIKMFFK